MSFALALLVATATPHPTPTKERPHTTYKVVDPPNVVFDTAQPMTLFMNRNGGTFHCPATPTSPDDASQNLSTIACGATNNAGTVTPFKGDDAAWQTVFQCIQHLYAPFNLVVTDQQPAAGSQYIEAVIGGSPEQMGQPAQVAGVAPFSCALEPGAVVYDFADVWGTDLESICETAGQETAHAFGLDHEFLCQDPMTYLTGCGDKTFQDEYVPCGEFQPRECNCGTPTQNSVQSMYQLFGSSDGSYVPPVDTAPPSVSITSPADGAILPSNESVVVTAVATDDTGFQDLELVWEFTGEHMACPAGSDTTGDYTCTRAGDTVTWTVAKGVGDRKFHVHAVDIGGNVVDTPEVNVWLSPDGNGPPADHGAPLITLDSPLAGASLPLSTDIEIVATMIDDTGVALAELNWQRQGTDRWIACDASTGSTGFGIPITCTKDGSTYTWHVQGRRAGDRNFQLRATDLVGNVTTTELQTLTFAAGATLPAPDANDSIDGATAMKCGDTVTTTGASADWYQVQAETGTEVTVIVQGEDVVIATDGKSAVAQATKSSTAKVNVGEKLDLAVVPSSAASKGSTITITCVPPAAHTTKPAAKAVKGCGQTGSAPMVALVAVLGLVGFRRRAR